ncbi:hypothetical protein FGB62_12g253 [Gracilaria domingensis]|nr:hypothetical protein FGB62_12g253 [Gracilaria domingensis]
MGKGKLTRLSLIQKIRLRHEVVKRWRKKCRVKKIQPNVIAEIIRGSPRTPSQAISFINNSRYLGFNPANFSPALCKAVLNRNLQHLLLREANALLPSTGGEQTIPKEARDVFRRASEGRYKICSRPYLPGFKEVAEIAHESLQNVVHKFESENRELLDSELVSVGESVALGAWFDKTTENDQPIRITIMHIGPKEKGHISHHKDKYPFWGAAVICLQERNHTDSGITLHNERTYDYAWLMRNGDMMIITPKLVQSVVVTATNREAYVLIVWF